MKKNNVIMILILVVLLSITLIGTYAYQTYTQDTIKNTFTIGNVSVELYEIDQSGNKIDDINQEYALERGKTYNKNMVVNVGAGSEDCYVYIVMENDLANVEAGESSANLNDASAVDYTPVATQIANNGWTKRTTSNTDVNIYWKEIDVSTDAGELDFMTEFRTKESFDYDLVRKEDNTPPVMSFTLYAVEKGSMDEANAWDLLLTKYPELATY
ncbi:MAG: hypothetical protein IJF43_01410 [Firmicutes bacterium]|nr:hypothetical protein [Bacillota bacterium]